MTDHPAPYGAPPAARHEDLHAGSGAPWPPGEAVPQFAQPFPTAPAPVTDLPDAPPPVRPGQAAPPQPGPQPGNVAGEPEPPVDEQEVILPSGEVITLTSGMQVRIKPLRTMELLALLNIGISGVGSRLGDLALDPDAPANVFVARFAGLLLTGLGSAGEETGAFLRMVCEPAAKVSTFRPDKAQRLRNAAREEALDDALSTIDGAGRRQINPHPDDTISIIEKVAEMNAGDLQQWGKRLAGIWRLAQRTGRIPASPPSPVYPS